MRLPPWEGDDDTVCWVTGRVVVVVGTFARCALAAAPRVRTQTAGMGLYGMEQGAVHCITHSVCMPPALLIVGGGQDVCWLSCVPGLFMAVLCVPCLMSAPG